MQHIKEGDHLLVIDNTNHHGQIDGIAEHVAWPAFGVRESGADPEADLYEFDQTDPMLAERCDRLGLRRPRRPFPPRVRLEAKRIEPGCAFCSRALDKECRAPVD